MREIHLFHLLIVAPILLVVGIRAVQEKKITRIEGVLLLFLALFAISSHASALLRGR